MVVDFKIIDNPLNSNECIITDVFCDWGTKEEKVLKIPEMINGKKVVSFAPNQHINREIEKVIFSDTIETIGVSAFEDCYNLKEIMLPDKPLHIGERAFHLTAYYNNSSNWEENILYIDRHLITKKKGLISCNSAIKIDTIDIASRAFSNTEFQYLVIPTNVSIIGIDAFAYSNFGSLTLPPAVKIYMSAFEGAYINNLHLYQVASVESSSFDNAKINRVYIKDIKNYAITFKRSIFNPETKLITKGGSIKRILEISQFNVLSPVFENLTIDSVLFDRCVIRNGAFKNSNINILQMKGPSSKYNIWIDGDVFEGAKIFRIVIKDEVFVLPEIKSSELEELYYEYG